MENYNYNDAIKSYGGFSKPKEDNETQCIGGKGAKMIKFSNRKLFEI
jgi:hypothetical protein